LEVENQAIWPPPISPDDRQFEVRYGTAKVTFAAGILTMNPNEKAATAGFVFGMLIMLGNFQVLREPVVMLHSKSPHVVHAGWVILVGTIWLVAAMSTLGGALLALLLGRSSHRAIVRFDIPSGMVYRHNRSMPISKASGLRVTAFSNKNYRMDLEGAVDLLHPLDRPIDPLRLRASRGSLLLGVGSLLDATKLAETVSKATGIPVLSTCEADSPKQGHPSSRAFTALTVPWVVPAKIQEQSVEAESRGPWQPPVGGDGGSLEAVFGNVTIRLEGGVVTVRSPEVRSPRNLVLAWLLALALPKVLHLILVATTSPPPMFEGMLLILPVVCAVSTVLYIVSLRTTRHHTIDLGRGIVDGPSGGHYLNQIHSIAVVPAAWGRRRLALTKADGTRLWLGSGRRPDIAQAAVALSQQTGIPTA